MTRVLIGTVLAFCVLGASAQFLGSDSDRCPTLDRCIDRIYEVAEPAPGLSVAEQAVINRLLEFGELAVPRLVEILSDANEGAATIAAATLASVDQIDPSYFPDIVAGLNRELAWLPPALARIGTDEAAEEAVRRYLAASSSPLNQEASAVQLSGSRAIPFLVEAARCDAVTCEARRFELLAVAFRDIGPVQATVADQLLAIARDASEESVSRGVLSVIAELGAEAIEIEEGLLALLETKPSLSEAVTEALIGIHSSFSADLVSDLLGDQDAYEVGNTLRDLSEIGNAALGAGPAVAALLESPYLEVTLDAARAIGFIGYRGAISELIIMLEDPFDVRLNWVAAESLGRLKDQRAEVSLVEVSDSHWYPPVRQAATSALAAIRGEAEIPNQPENGNFSAFFFEYRWVTNEGTRCQNLNGIEVINPDTGVVREDDDPSLLESFSIESRYGRRSPQAAWPVDGGWLAGSDYGEWSGELVYVDQEGNKTVLVEDNIVEIYPFADAFVVVSGVSHLGLSGGTLYRLSRSDDGQWITDEWRKLPDAPYAAWLVDTGELLVETYNEGSMLISPNGAIRMAPCADG